MVSGMTPSAGAGLLGVPGIVVGTKHLWRTVKIILGLLL